MQIAFPDSVVFVHLSFHLTLFFINIFLFVSTNTDSLVYVIPCLIACTLYAIIFTPVFIFNTINFINNILFSYLFTIHTTVCLSLFDIFILALIHNKYNWHSIQNISTLFVQSAQSFIRSALLCSALLGSVGGAVRCR